MKTIIEISLSIILILVLQKSNAQVQDTIDGQIHNFLISPPKSGTLVVFPKLKKFAGTWYTKQNGIEITLKLELFSHPFKKEPTFYIQFLGGGVKYSKNDTVMYNNLNDMNIIADIGDNGQKDMIEVLISDKTRRNRHPVNLKLKDSTTLEFVPSPSWGEGISPNEKYTSLNGMVLKK
ncbi:hypothetical protein OQY15_20745 [Pedobacter sp. MC2016-15]|uniref:DUF6705 family protein n=1 Tax=Pedobacter sp. MC2016-15 TaxID=2994473 RepID=UPI0022474DB0|nr:DUF6705 family protein [Pedobacter sp. MC2016-15]MCX2481541.1 hypothetical protein [Pedobacter sp. MC2016-15]